MLANNGSDARAICESVTRVRFGVRITSQPKTTSRSAAAMPPAAKRRALGSKVLKKRRIFVPLLGDKLAAEDLTGLSNCFKSTGELSLRVAWVAVSCAAI